MSADIAKLGYKQIGTLASNILSIHRCRDNPSSIASAFSTRKQTVYMRMHIRDPVAWNTNRSAGAAFCANYVRVFGVISLHLFSKIEHALPQSLIDEGR